MAIEDFVASIPGFFDSHVVSDPASAILPLMSDHPTTDPILGSRLLQPSEDLYTRHLIPHRRTSQETSASVSEEPVVLRKGV
jgi:hypothetical protein